MTTHNVKQDISISMDDFNYLDGALSQVHSLTVFIIGNDNYKSMPPITLANLIWTASDQIAGVLADCAEMFFDETPKEQLRFEQLLVKAKTVLDALRNSEEFGRLLGDHLSNVIWLVESLLEDALKELGKIPIRHVEQAA